MGVNWNNLISREPNLYNGCLVKCGKKPIEPKLSDFSFQGPNAMKAYNDAKRNFELNNLKWNECMSLCQKVYENTQETIKKIEEEKTQSTHGTTEMIPPINVNEQSEQKPEPVPKYKLSTGMKIGIVAGLLILAFVGYKALSKNKHN